MKKNEIVELYITGLLHDGTGVGRLCGAGTPGTGAPEAGVDSGTTVTGAGTHGTGCDNAAVFVPGTAVGDRVSALIVKKEKTFYRGKLREILTPSPDRATPVCNVFGRCGGCAFQHITYAAELQAKRRRVEDCLNRIGGLHAEVKDTVPSPNTLYYRNKAQYPVACADGRPVLGFYAPRSHRVVDASDCRIQHKDIKTAAEVFTEFLRKFNIEPYDELTGSSLVRHLFVRVAEATGQMIVMPVINGRRLPNSDTLVSMLKDSLPGLTSVFLNFNELAGNVILGPECEKLWGEDYIEDTLRGLRVRISPLSFYQVNRSACENLYAKCAEYAQLTGAETVLDLYCGAGTIGLSMAARAKRVIGVESVGAAVSDARENARINGIENAEFFHGDAGEAGAQLCGREKPDVVIVDPPRGGCGQKLIKAICDIAADRVIYVSCDPATLARDLSVLCGGGYRLTEVTPFDMFPRTSHVECCSLLERGD